MAPRSMQLRPECVEVAKAAFKNSSYPTQIRLAIEADIQAQSTVSAFFRGKPVDRANFIKLGQLLNLDPLVVGEKPVRQVNRELVINPITDICREGEHTWYEKLFEISALIKIQAPSQFGKTSLMWKMFDRAEQQGHLALYLNLNALELASFRDAQTFFRCFICEIASELEEQYIDFLMPLEQYDELVQTFGHTKAYLKYLEHLQKKIPKPLTLGINKLDLLLDFPDTADEFLFQLRNMNEKSKQRGVWKNFRLVLAYSTPRVEEFVTVVANRSPFNVGETIELTEFSPSEVAELVTKKGVALDKVQIVELMELIGGIPSLVQLTLNYLQSPGADLATIKPIYQEHLEILELWLQQRDLYKSMQQIAINPTTTTLSRQQQNLLYRQGLVILKGHQVMARCELYRQFFTRN
jgi:AAA-like domain